MSISRLENNVPDVYVEKSRDFQLLLRLYDAALRGVRFNIDSMTNLTSTMMSDSRMLELLGTKLGFFTRKSISDDDLRYVLRAFPYIIKNKGNVTGIKDAVNVFMKINKINVPVYVSIINKKRLPGEDDYVIQIGLNSTVRDIAILDSMIQYVVPTCYTVKYLFYVNPVLMTEYIQKNETNVLFTTNEITSMVDNDFTFIGETTWKLRDKVQLEAVGSFDLEFTANGTRYSKIEITDSVIKYGTTTVYRNGSWVTPNYASIEIFGDQESETFRQLKQWMKENTESTVELLGTVGISTVCGTVETSTVNEQGGTVSEE